MHTGFIDKHFLAFSKPFPWPFILLLHQFGIFSTTFHFTISFFPQNRIKNILYKAFSLSHMWDGKQFLTFMTKSLTQTDGENNFFSCEKMLKFPWEFSQFLDCFVRDMLDVLFWFKKHVVRCLRWICNVCLVPLRICNCCDVFFCIWFDSWRFGSIYHVASLIKECVIVWRTNFFEFLKFY